MQAARGCQASVVRSDDVPHEQNRVEGRRGQVGSARSSALAVAIGVSPGMGLPRAWTSVHAPRAVLSLNGDVGWGRAS